MDSDAARFFANVVNREANSISIIRVCQQGQDVDIKLAEIGARTHHAARTTIALTSDEGRLDGFIGCYSTKKCMHSSHGQ